MSRTRDRDGALFGHAARKPDRRTEFRIARQPPTQARPAATGTKLLPGRGRAVSRGLGARVSGLFRPAPARQGPVACVSSEGVHSLSSAPSPLCMSHCWLPAARTAYHDCFCHPLSDKKSLVHNYLIEKFPDHLTPNPEKLYRYHSVTK